jgi:hypothetical protein
MSKKKKVFEIISILDVKFLCLEETRLVGVFLYVFGLLQDIINLVSLVQKKTRVINLFYE